MDSCLRRNDEEADIILGNCYRVPNSFDGVGFAVIANDRSFRGWGPGRNSLQKVPPRFLLKKLLLLAPSSGQLLMIVAALITAAGSGVRMGSRIPKQYLALRGVPILARTLMAFEKHPLVDRIVVTVPPGDEDRFRSRVLDPFDLKKVIAVIAGGETRQASVYYGLIRLEETDIVAIHDGVRPLVSAEVITATIRAAESTGAALACVPVRDTVKKRTGAHLETIPREDLWLAQTPQTFRTGLMLKAHRKALEEGFIGTDDAMLVERLGLPVDVVEDSRDNIKITTPEDLELAGMLLERQEVVDLSVLA
jgi:2-C-methyl-D-erythritol 4-phosphate cytidylyltransferase